MLVNGAYANSIGIRDRGLLYGDGVFRTMRAVNGRLRHWPQHYRKLHHDCQALDIPCHDEATLGAELARLLEQHPEGVVKLIITRGAGGRGYAPGAALSPTHIWDCHPAPVYPAEWGMQGVKVRICDLRLSAQPRLAGIKHLNRLENVLAAAELDRCGAQAAEGLLLSGEGSLIEGTRSNLFLVTAQGLVTPDLSRCGVAGLQRERVMAWALRQGMRVQVREVSLYEALHADELFLVNSVIGLWSIRELDHAEGLMQAPRLWSLFPLASRIRRDLESSDA